MGSGANLAPMVVAAGFVLAFVFGLAAARTNFCTMGALATGSFRWEGFASLADLRQQLVGAGLMGAGGVTAAGCTIGQGLSGVSTLAIGSFIAVAGIVLGGVATLKVLVWLEERSPELGAVAT